MGNYGFHYVDWQFDGDDLAVASRSAWNADSQHNSNLILFHREENFRELEIADSVPSGEALWEYPDVTIQGVGFRPAMLGEGELAFSNRTHLWQGVPTALAGQFILRINGGTIPQMHVTAKRDFTLRVATASASGPPGWTAEGITFGYNANTTTPLYLFAKAMTSGEQLDIPQLGFSGTLPIIRPWSRPLARGRVSPGGLPAVADWENAFHIDTINGNGRARPKALPAPDSISQAPSPRSPARTNLASWTRISPSPPGSAPVPAIPRSIRRSLAKAPRSAAPPGCFPSTGPRWEKPPSPSARRRSPPPPRSTTATGITSPSATPAAGR